MHNEADSFTTAKNTYSEWLDIDSYAGLAEELSMADAPTTRPSLLLRISDARDHEAWRTFVKLYAPLVYRFARTRGLQDAEAAGKSPSMAGDVHEATSSFDCSPEEAAEKVVG